MFSLSVATATVRVDTMESVQPNKNIILTATVSVDTVIFVYFIFSVVTLNGATATV